MVQKLSLLSKKQIEQFHEDGYIVVERNIPYSTLKPLQEACDRIVEKSIESKYKYARADRRLSDRAIEKIEHVFSQEFFELELFDAVVQSEILDYTFQLLGTKDIYLAFNRMHPTRKYSAWSNWHRDAKVDGIYHFLKATLPLFSETGFFVIPGSHKKDNRQLAGSSLDTLVRTNLGEQVRVPVRAGDLLFFHSAIWHRGTCAGRERYRRAQIHLNFINYEQAETIGQVNQDYLHRDEVMSRCSPDWKSVIRKDVPQTYKLTNAHPPSDLKQKMKQMIARAFYYGSSFIPGDQALTDNPPQWLVPYVRVPAELEHYYDLKETNLNQSRHE